MSAVLTCRAVTARYGPIEVCHGIDLDVQPGRVTVVTGPNGSGKTTFLRRLSGHCAGGGSILLGQSEVGQLSAHQRSKRGIFTVPDTRGLFPELSVRENVELALLLIPKAQRKQALAGAAERFPVLTDRPSAPVAVLSGGEQQMVALARVLVVRPKVLLLDEPSQGLAPRIVEEIADVIKGLCGLEVGVLLVEQHLGLAAAVADSVAVFINGEKTASGEGAELLDEDTLAEAYLGPAAGLSDRTVRQSGSRRHDA